MTLRNTTLKHDDTQQYDTAVQHSGMMTLSSTTFGHDDTEQRHSIMSLNKYLYSTMPLRHDDTHHNDTQQKDTKHFEI